MSETAETTGWTGAEQMEVLTFELNGELFALEAVAVQEIMDLAPETVVPGQALIGARPSSTTPPHRPIESTLVSPSTLWRAVNTTGSCAVPSWR